MIIGAHLTIAQGLPAAMQLCRDLGGSTFQFFTRNPRGGKQREMGEEEIARGNRLRRELGIQTLVGHFPYTVNLASPKPSAYGFAVQTLHADLRWGDRMGADVLVVHPGSHVGEGVDAGIERIVAAMHSALDGYVGQTKLLLETMSGQGSEVGSEPAHLRRIFAALDWHPTLGICLDSCHLFAAGFDLRTPDGVAATLQAFADAGLQERIHCLHLNDSKAALGSHRDRHELIAQGELGEAGVRAVLAEPFIRTLPIVLETPVNDLSEYAGEIARTRDLAGHGVQ